MTERPAISHIVIVGGGVIGSALAWFLAREHDVQVTVLERDTSYERASSARSVCSIRQQFSSAINVQLSQQSLVFYRRIGVELGTADDVPLIGLVEPGYLYLAASEAGAAQLRSQRAMQRTFDVHTALLDAEAVSARFPWLHTSDVVLGSLGLSTATSGEGWFDGYAAMRAFQTAARRAGAAYLQEEAVDFTVTGDARERAVRSVRCASGRDLACDAVVIAGGAWSAPLAALLGVDLPVRARKRDVFAFEASDIAADSPLVIDPSGVWFRAEVQRGRYLCGAPPRGADLDDLSLDHVDHGLFDDVIWPVLAARVPVFDAVRVVASWSGYYELNVFDHNGLVGALPAFGNAFTACGFSGHGLQQAPAVGRALAERIVHGAYRSLDLSVLGVERVAGGRPVLEHNVI